tara:strand:+ start:1656 stop:2480 length:825 start_codon:yes stop_codon:yes gene_type:complete
MPYIGTQPLTGQFKKLDAISVVNGQAAYTLNYNSAAYKPATANALLVSVNGVIQAAGDAYTISGSTITFTENLVTGDVIDFIIALGDTGSAVTPVDGSVTTAKLGDDSVTKAKIGTTELDLATIKDSTGTNTAMTIDSTGRVFTPARPQFYAYDGSAAWQSLASFHQVVFPNTLYNVGNHYSTSTGYFTAPVDGLYSFSGKLYLNNTNNSSYYIAINGSGENYRYHIATENTAGDMTISFAENIELTSGQYVSVLGYTGEYYKAHSTFQGFLVG